MVLAPLLAKDLGRAARKQEISLLSPAYHTTVLILFDSLLVILARGCRAKNPDLFARPGAGFEIPRARQTRARE